MLKICHDLDPEYALEEEEQSVHAQEEFGIYV